MGGVSGVNKVYDGNTTAALAGTATVTPLGGDNLTVTGAGSGVFTNKNVGTGKAVTVSGYTLGGADAANYVVLVIGERSFLQIDVREGVVAKLLPRAQPHPQKLDARVRLAVVLGVDVGGHALRGVRNSRGALIARSGGGNESRGQPRGPRGPRIAFQYQHLHPAFACRQRGDQSAAACADHDDGHFGRRHA